MTASVTAPSTGVELAMQPRLDVAIAAVENKEFEVVVGDCMDGTGVVSAPAVDRAAELQDMLVDPSIQAVVPPWGGQLAVEILPLLDFAAIAAAEPTWLVGWSDISTLLMSDSGDFTQRDAVESALGHLDVPVILDVDCGHVPPHLALVNGALADVVFDGDTQTITQTLA